MCLYVNYKTPSIAEVDITCYKVYIFYNNQEYISPYRKAKMPPMDTLTITELDENNPVNKGFHSFVNSIDAKLYSYKGRDSIVVSCIIPKGAKYYKGFFENCESYCSDSIILKEEICV